MKSNIIGTLGPTGTSSEYAAQYYIKQLKCDCAPSIKLYASFDLVLENLLLRKIDYAIVPHAYSHINQFYMHPNLDLVGLYALHTPCYGLYQLKQQLSDHSHVATLALHPATEPLIQQLFDVETRKKLKLKIFNSTSLAARAVVTHHADLAITNQIAADRHDLQLIRKLWPIKMGWSAFTTRGVI